LYEHFYNWAELERWNLTDSKLIPSDSIFYNRDTSFFELYKWYILGVFLFILSQTILIIYLIRLNRKQKAISVKMEETESMYRELIRTDRLSKMSTLTASLSHELFQPLSAIRLTAEAGKRFIETNKLDNDKAFRMFENILEDDIRATKIITSVKSLMKTEAPEKANVNLNALINETVDLISADLRKFKIKIKTGFESDPVFVFGDKIQLQQVVMNFIRNAATAMEKIEPETRILEINLRTIKSEAVVSVRDYGPGIDASVKEKLFKPFVSTKKEGFGIGLTLCKSLIENHNGKIWAEDIPEGGTMFSFSIKMIRND
jgi:signal transduction histidine kinase